MSKSSSLFVGRSPRTSCKAELCREWRADFRFPALVGWLITVFLFGGSSRTDVASLQLIWPLSLFVLAFGLSRLTAEDFRRNRFVLGCAVAWFALLAIQLVPLPPSLWQTLGGREIVREIDTAAALGDVWRPLSMAPYATRNALWSSVAPAAILVLGAGLPHQDLTRLVPVLLALAFLSVLIAILQILGDPKGPLYFYESTFNGLPVGLLANRNNQALFLATAIPMLGVWRATKVQTGSKREMRWPLALGGIMLLIPMILLTGSRTGSVLGMLGLLSLLLLLNKESPSPQRASRKDKFPYRKLLIGASVSAVLGILALTIALGRALSINRLMAPNPTDDLRFQIYPTLFQIIDIHLPWGSGIGSFYPIYRMSEPSHLLSKHYMNQAHNDWLDLVLTGGIPAIILLIVIIAGISTRLYWSIRTAPSPQTAQIARLGFVIAAMLCVASATEYPLRVPSIACLGVIALLWINTVAQPVRNKDSAGANI